MSTSQPIGSAASSNSEKARKPEDKSDDGDKVAE